MSRILLADDSPHAQRMGERILREEGFEVVTVTDGNTALLRLRDVDPDLVLADVSLPGKSGYEICRTVKQQAGYSHVRVVLTAGLLEPFDDVQANAAKCDAVLKKPFESSVVLDTIKPLIEAAKKDKSKSAAVVDLASAAAVSPAKEPVAEPTVEITPEPEPVRRAPSMPTSRGPFVAVPVRVVREPVMGAAAPAPAAAEPAVVQHPPAVPVDVRPFAISLPPQESPGENAVKTGPAAPLEQVDADRIRAAVTLALDAALPKMIDEITERVLLALGH
jgi:CheY-like chemotaxis protein